MIRRLLVCVLLAAAVVPGCATREVMQSAVERGGLEISLREQKRGFGVVRREFQHPAQISPQRLANILGAIDIRGREAEMAGIRSAFEPSQLQEISEALSEALRKASPDQEIVVQITYKQMQHVIFDRKHLTSFVAYVQDDLLYLFFSRVDWEIPERVKKTALPIPRVNEHPMKFRVVPSEGMFAEGIYAVAVEWQDPVFQRPLRRTLPDDERRERTILIESPDLPEARRSSLPADVLPWLTPAQLRELADLEEARQAGTLSEGRYRRAREKILEAARKEGAASQ